MMTPSRIKDRRLSLFTLALLQGTGWYQPDYSSYAEPMTYGKDAGCAFFNTECINRETLEPNFKEFCSPLTSFGVSYTKRGLGYCGSYRYQTSDDLISAFDYWGNKTVVWDSFADNCPQVDVSYDCENITRGTIALLEDYESYGIGGKGFLGTLSLDGTPYSRFVDYCFKTQCKLNKGHYELQVLFGRGKEGDNVTCTTAGQVDASDFPFEHNLVGALKCPDPDEFCNQVLEEGVCKGQCFGRGVCSHWENKCVCNDGWGSHHCAKKALTDQCSRCTSDPLRTSCYGDDECHCNPSNTTCQCLLGLKTGKECSGGDNNNGSQLGVILTVGGGILAVAVILGCCLVKKRKGRMITDDSLSHPIVLSSNDDVETSTL